jgi:hypothetical protein
MKELRRYIRLVLEASQMSKLRVFDFDDTLAVSDSMVLVQHTDGASELLTPAEFNSYKPEPGDEFDFSQFEDVINPRAVVEVTQILTKILNAELKNPGDRKIAILTSRGQRAQSSIQGFLDELLGGASNIEIVTLGSSDPADKRDWIDQQIGSYGFQDVRFFDDSEGNVAAVLELKAKYPDIKIRAQNIKYAESY